jgi:hypothetical protein
MLGWACATPIHAGQSDFGIGLSLVHNSNIARVETDPRSEWTRSLTAGLFYQENTVDVTARVLAQVERRHFARQTFSDDTTGYVDGAVIWTILPRRFAWTVEDVFRTVQVDITAPDTPANRTKANSLSTGPDFTFPLSSTNSAVIGGRYGRFDIENSNTDNRRYTAFARGVHAVSAQTKLSLNYEGVRAHFEPGAQVFPKALREDWFGRFENRSVINSTTIDVGTSRVTRYGGPALEGRRLERLTLSEAFTPQSTLRLAFSDQTSDTYTDLIRGVTSATTPTDSGAVLVQSADLARGDLYHSKRGDLAYVNNDGHFAWTLQAYWRRVDFETLDQDYRENGGRFLWSWFSGPMRFNVSAESARRAFSPVDPKSPVLGRKDADRNYSAAVTYRLSGNVTVTMEGGRIERESTAPSASFVDGRVMLLLGYSSGRLYEAQSRR